ncbi:hypothetical protein [Streptomyces purpurogeneiscleroticus]|uniref:hypothetical protein n=1 Tax=Streptomyces purpurogeneiscleroticus TaxID=68259 RepID=UPI001CC19AB2|nr:hypothetical protein [Streptomyces purpurogeneiscleroticus]
MTHPAEDQAPQPPVMVEHDALRAAVAALFASHGVPQRRARTAATALCYGDLTGLDSHAPARRAIHFDCAGFHTARAAEKGALARNCGGRRIARPPDRGDIGFFALASAPEGAAEHLVTTTDRGDQ